MLILVKTETGTTIGISAEPNDKIEKVKLIISNKHKISFHEQKLTYNGKLLQNNKTLRDYHIKNNCTLHLMTKTRGMINAVEKSNHISLMNKSKTKSIKLESYYISDKSDIFDGSNMIGIVLYQHNGQTEWESLNGIQCKSGFVYLCKTDSLKNIHSSPFNTKHAKCYKKLFGEDPDYTKIVGAAFGYVDKKWKYNSGTFNAPNIRSSMIAEERRSMHKYEEQWLKQTIEQWISSDFSETICYVSDVNYVSYVTWNEFCIASLNAAKEEIKEKSVSKYVKTEQAVTGIAQIANVISQRGWDIFAAVADVFEVLTGDVKTVVAAVAKTVIAITFVLSYLLEPDVGIGKVGIGWDIFAAVADVFEVLTGDVKTVVAAVAKTVIAITFVLSYLLEPDVGIGKVGIGWDIFAA
eukprot:203875_1